MTSVLQSDIHLAVPKILKIENRFDAGCIARTTRSWSASNDIYQPNGVKTISITIPASAGWVDFSNSYVTGTLSCISGLTTKSVHSCIRRVRVVASNGQVISDTDAYNVLETMLADITLTAAETAGAFAITSLMNRSAAHLAAPTGRTFAFQPLVSILRSDKLIPLQYLGSLTVEITLDETSTSFVGTGVVSPNYTFKNVKYVCDIVTVDEQIENLTRQAYEQGRLRWHFQGWRHAPFQSDSLNYDLRIETLDNSCKALLICPRDASKLTDQTVDSFERTHGNLTEVQYQIGANLLEKFTQGAQLYMELEKMIEHTNNGVITVANWEDGTKFMLGLNLSIVQDENFLSGYSSRGSITVRLTRSAATPTSVSYYTYVLHDVVVVAGPSGCQVQY